MNIEDRANILLVDDQPERLMTYEAILSGLSHNLVRANSGTEALQRLMEMEFAAILLDVSMPGMDGFETAGMIHGHPRFEKTPIIFVTGVHVTDIDRLKGYEVGAVDYVYVPVVPEILRGKVQVLVELYLKRRELQRVNQQLLAQNQATQESLESIMANLSEAFVQLDHEFRYTYINAATIKLSGLKAQDFIGRTVWEVFPNTKDTVLEREFRRAMKEHLAVRFEYFYPEWNRWFEHRVYPTANGIAAFWVDVTARKAAELREKRRAEQFAKLTNASLAMNSAMSLRERIKIISEHAREVIGAHLAITSMTGESEDTKVVNAISLSDKYASWHSSFTPPDESELDLLICRVNRRSLRLAQKELEADAVLKRLNREKTSRPPLREWLAASLIGLNGRNIGLIQLSDKHEGSFTADDEHVLVQLAQLASVAIENSKLLQSQQAAVRHRDEFLGVASHELRTPLTALKLQLQLTEKLKRHIGSDSLPPEKLKKIFSTFDRQVESLVGLVDDLLDVSRIVNRRMKLDIQGMDLSQAVMEAVESFTEELQAAKCTLSLRADEPITGNWDRKRIEQVVSNLVSNAIKYAAGKPIDVLVERVGDVARLVVKDYGVGIAEENLERIFDRFERGTSHPGIAGLGLGLFISKQIVQLHGGSIRAESAPGSGAAFIVELPTVAAYQHTAGLASHANSAQT